MSNWLKDFENAFNNAITCYYLTDIQEHNNLSDEEMLSLMFSNYEKEYVDELLGEEL